MAIKLIGTKKLPTVIGNDGCEVLTAKEFLCDTDADFANLPECCVSSMAVSIESGTIRVVDSYGRWVQFGVYTEPPKPPVDDSVIAGTWVFNDEIDLSTFPSVTEVVFTSHDITMGSNICKSSTGPSSWGIDTLAYEGNPVYKNNPSGNYGITHGWSNEAYKTITILEEPTDAEFIAWLTENATKVS